MHGRSAVVIGGGISGLACAHYLVRPAVTSPGAIKVNLVDKHCRLGGWLESSRRPNGGVHDHGPRSVRPVGESGKNLLALLDQVQLSKEVLSVTSKNAAARNRLLLVDGLLRPLPSSIGGMFSTTPPFQRPLAWYLMKDLFGTKAGQPASSDESVHGFLSRHFGHEIAEFVGDPLCRGVFAGDSRQLSAKALLKDSYLTEREFGSIIRGSILKSLRTSRKTPLPGVHRESSSLVQKAVTEKWSTWSLKGGMQTLVDGLTVHLHNLGVAMHTTNSCTAIKFQTTPRKAIVHLRNGKRIEADHVFAAVPTAAMANLIGDDHKQFGQMLRPIEYVTVAVINLEFASHVLPLKAFGFLVPSSQKSKILGVVFDSCCFPQLDAQGSTRLTVMMGGQWFEELFGSSPDPKKMLNIALDELKSCLHIHDDPVWSQVLIHKDCIPQYRVGHSDRVAEMRNYIEKMQLPLSLVGSAFDGISVNDCVFSARNQVEAFLRKKQGVIEQ